MLSSSTISRSQLILGLCLPLAVLMGYFLAAPLESDSLAVTVLVFSVLSIPLLMRWYHPLLVLSWNACINPFFLPGRPYVWMLMSLAGFFFALLNRATDPSKRFLYVPSVTKALICVVIVVVATAFFTGGIGLRALGSARYGGKGYFYILIAVIGYFAFVSQAVPRERAGWYAGMFFLSGLTSVVSNLAYLGGRKFYFLFELFPPEFAMSQAFAEISPLQTAVRIGGVVWTSQAIWCFMLARYGIHGMFDFSRPWRMAIILVAVILSLFGGFRSAVVQFCLVFAVLFYIERLWRTRVMLLVLLGSVLCGSGLMLFADRLPLSAQRALSFLPIQIDVATRMDAESSTEWRVEMWKTLLPDVPKYFFKGKGYSINPQDLHLINESAMRGYVSSADVSALAGDYHNGPLSILIPFGVYGLIAFGWFFAVGLRVLYKNYRFGEPALQLINNFLLALYISRVVFFFLVFGSVYSDLFYFVGLIGLSVALNGGVRELKDSVAAGKNP